MPQVPLLCPVLPHCAAKGQDGAGGCTGYALNPVPGMDGEGLGLFTGIYHRAEVTL